METGVGYPGESPRCAARTYQQERRDHAKAMIDLSVTGATCWLRRNAGRVRYVTAFPAVELSAASKTLLPRNALQAEPQYYGGALMREGEAKHSPVARCLFSRKSRWKTAT